MIELTRSEWTAYCEAEAVGDLDAQREIIRQAEQRTYRKLGNMILNNMRNSYKYDEHVKENMEWLKDYVFGEDN